MKVPFLSLRDISEKYREELHEAVLRVVDSGWYLQGKENAIFEQHYAEYIGTKYCVGCAYPYLPCLYGTWDIESW